MAEQNVVGEAPEFVAEPHGGNFEQDDFAEGSEGDGGPAGQPNSGVGPSKSSRRRRRKRKKIALAGTGAEGAAVEGGDGGVSIVAPLVMEGESLALAASANGVAAAVPAQRRPPFNGGQSHGSNGAQGQGQGQQGQGQQGQGIGKRWKKKFRDRERRTTGGPGGPGGDARPESNGNGAGGERSMNGDRGFERPHRREGGGRPDNFGNLVSHTQRKTKGTGQGRERGFVGPMDHSYREVNPEFGEAPPSTIQLRGRRGHRQQGDSQPIDHNAPRAVPIAEDAQTHIYMFVEDLFVTAKVQETARKLGVKVAFLKNEKDAIAELTSGEEQNKPSLIVFDLNNANAKPLTLIPKLKAKLKRSASIVGFLSMIQGDLKAKAMEAGCDTVMPKAAFSQSLPNLLRRYGVHETEEVNFNY